MALTLVVEDGTGLETANVYDTTTACETELTELGFTVFASVSTTIQDQALFLATRTVEATARTRVEGEPYSPDQGLLFPRINSRSRDYLAHDWDERPAKYRSGIFVMAEHWAEALRDGRRLSSPTADSSVKSERLEGHEIVYKSTAGFWSQYPEAWELIREAWTPGRKNKRS